MKLVKPLIILSALTVICCVFAGHQANQQNEATVRNNDTTQTLAALVYLPKPTPINTSQWSSIQNGMGQVVDMPNDWASNVNYNSVYAYSSDLVLQKADGTKVAVNSPVRFPDELLVEKIASGAWIEIYSRLKTMTSACSLNLLGKCTVASLCSAYNFGAIEKIGTAEVCVPYNSAKTNPNLVNYVIAYEDGLQHHLLEVHYAPGASDTQKNYYISTARTIVSNYLAMISSLNQTSSPEGDQMSLPTSTL